MKNSRIPVFIGFLLLTFMLVGCSGAASDTEDDAQDDVPYVLSQTPQFTMEVTSSSVDDDNRLLQGYTCEGQDTSPQISWSGAPDGTQSFVLIMEDPASDGGLGGVDATATDDEDAEIAAVKLRTHWILYSIPADVTELETNAATREVLPNGAKHDINDFEEVKYRGPCPTPTIIFGGGTVSIQFQKPIVSQLRPYYFNLYALDKTIDLEAGATRNAVLKEMDGNILAAGQLAPEYRSRKRIVQQMKNN